MPNTRLLSAALIAFGAAFCLLYAMLIIWPSGWAWHEGSPASNDYFMMIAGVYVTLGIFMFRAARDPLANASLIWFVGRGGGSRSGLLNQHQLELRGVRGTALNTNSVGRPRTRARALH